MATDGTRALIAKALSTLPLIFSAVALLISFQSFELTAVRSVKPILIVTYRGDVGWSLKNVGNGPALNVVVAERGKGDWFKPVRVPPVAVGSELVLRWLDQTNIKSIGVTYFDIDGRQYTSLTTQDLTTIMNGNRLAKWPEPDIRKMWELPENPH